MNNIQSNIQEGLLEAHIEGVLNQYQQPSANELLRSAIEIFGEPVRQELKGATLNLLQTKTRSSNKSYLQHLIDDGSLDQAIANHPDANSSRRVESEIDLLIQSGVQYRKSEAFKQVINFMAQFRDYSPFNNMLVYLQNPGCNHYATAKDWKKRFNRVVKEDERPMVILAPMHPVILVYATEQTEGKPIPEDIEKFAEITGNWNDDWLENLVENAQRYKIQISYKPLTTSLAGFATAANQDSQWKMRIVINDQFDQPTIFGILCHELAHILLGHIDGDKNLWWPSRINLKNDAREIEAEAVAYIVTERLGLKGKSAAYVSGYLKNGEQIPNGVSLDNIAKVASKLQKMTEKILPEPKVKK